MKIHRILIFAAFAGLCLSPAFAQVQITNYTTADGLPEDFICGGIAIADGNIVWAATNIGIARFDGNSWTSFDTGDGLIDNYTTAIAVDASNHVWVGTEMGASMWNGTGFTNFTTNEGLIDNGIRHIACDEAGNVYFATFSGLSVYNGSSFQNYNSGNGLPTDLLTFVCVVNSTDIWLGSLANGAIHFDGTSFTAYTTAEGLTDDNISSIAVDAAGNKFLSSFQGIDVLNADNAYTTTYNNEDGVFAPYADGIYHNYVQFVHVDVYSNLWALVFVDYLDDGAVCYLRDGTWHSITEANGLADALVIKLATQSDGVAWVATGLGISKIDIYVGNQVLNTAEINISPNPASDYIEVSGVNENTGFTITDMCGKVISGLSLNNGRLDISSLNDGMYLIAVISGDSVKTLRFVKE